MANTKTAVKKRISSPDYEQAPNTEWDDAAALYNSFTTDAVFYSMCHQRGVDISDPQTQEYAYVSSEYIGDICEERLREGTITEAAASRLVLIADLPAHFWRESELGLFQSYGLSKLTAVEKDYRNQLKDAVIQYNQLASNYLYKNPDSLLDEIVTATASASLSHAPDHIGGPKDQLRMLRGARTEAIGFSLLDKLSAMIPDRLSYRPATVEEDRCGADAIVLFDKQRFGLDFKSSLDGVESDKHGGHYDHTFGTDFHIQSIDKNTGIVTARIVPQIDETALGTRCRLPESEVMPAALHLGDQLLQMHKLTTSAH